MNYLAQRGSFFELYSQHPDAHLLLDHDGVIIAINPAGERELWGAVHPVIGARFAAITEASHSLSGGAKTATTAGLEEEVAVVASGGIRRLRGRFGGTDSLLEFTLTPQRESAPSPAAAVAAQAAFPVAVLVAVRPASSDDPRMLSRNRRFESLGTLALGITHDLNNALTPILLSAQLLLQNEPNETNRRLLTSIESSAIHGANLISRVLRFVRGGESASFILDARATIAGVVEGMRDSLPTEFSIETALGQQPLLVLGDSTQLQQVVRNLISNAREAMPDGGRVVIRAHSELVSTVVDSLAAAIIEVEDSGTGIAKEVFAEIFEPFFTTKALGGGTGLGLSTSLNIVRAWGGTLIAINNAETGATFRLTLPLVSQLTDGNRKDARTRSTNDTPTTNDTASEM